MSSILKGLMREGGKRTVKGVADEIASYIGDHPSDSAIVDAVEHEAELNDLDPSELFDAVYDHFRDHIDENLHKWFKEKWVRFGPDGKIRGACARGSSKEGKPKCLPQKKAQNLGKKGRKYAAAKKRREDPNPDRHGKAKNVATKKKSNEDISHLDEKWSAKYKSSINCSHPKGFSQKAHCAGKKKHNESIEMEMTCEDCGMCQTHGNHTRDTLDEACWKGYHKEGNKELFGKTVPNCVKNEGVAEGYSNFTFNVDRRKLNVPALIQKGAIIVTHPHGEQGWETDNKEDWAFSLLSLYNVLQGGWASESKKYLKPESYKRAEQQINSSAPNLGSDKLVYDGKYNQILWSIKKLGIPDNVAFLDKSEQGVAEGESPANTLYFFDVGRGGRSFTNVDLRAMGLQQSQSGKWYYRPGGDSTPLLLKTTLDHLAKQLNVPPKPWQRPRTNEGIRDVLNFGIKKPTVKPAAPMDDFTAKIIANKQKNLKILHPKEVYKSPEEYTKATGNKIKESADYLEEK